MFTELNLMKGIIKSQKSKVKNQNYLDLDFEN